MHIALILLNLVFLVLSMAFNAKLLSLGGSDITLAYFNKIAEIGQLLSSFGFTLIIWRVLSFRRQGKALAKAWLISFLIAYPSAYVAQDMVSAYIANNLSHPYKVASLYAYVAKKEFSSRLDVAENNGDQNQKATGAERAFLVNLGILLNPDSAYIQKIDSNFSGYATAVFTRYIGRHSEDFYSRYENASIQSIKDITKIYSQNESYRISGLSFPKTPTALTSPINSGNIAADNENYANSLPHGIKTMAQIERQKNIHVMAKDRLGPLYVNGMDLLSNKEKFLGYVPSIASNMASEITATDINGAQGQMVVKNMIFLPIALFTSLFFGVISLVTLIFELIKLKTGQTSKIKTRICIIAVFLLAPLVIGNEIISSEAYINGVSNSGNEINMISPILKWSMVTEGWLYDLVELL